MSGDTTFLLFLTAGIVGMFVAGLIGDWWHRRELHLAITAPWRDRAPGEGFEKEARDA